MKPFPLADRTVSYLHVGEHIPNRDSISATLTDYRVLVGVRAVPIKLFKAAPHELFYAADDLRRVDVLAEEIRRSRRIDPLIVVVDKEGSYILEGAHRLGALYLLKRKAFPALVVIDEA